MEEVDEKIFVHVKHASSEHVRIMIKTADSNVVVTVIANFNQLVPLNELWIEFCGGNSLIFIPIHQIATNSGPDKSSTFLCSMRLVAANTKSSLRGKGKKSFFDTWTSMDEISPLYIKLSSATTLNKISDDEFELLEFFLVRLYSKTCNIKEVNEARQILFSWDNKVIENTPPTKGAPMQHVLRSVFQSSKWQQSLCKDFDSWHACQWV